MLTQLAFSEAGLRFFAKDILHALQLAEVEGAESLDFQFLLLDVEVVDELQDHGIVRGVYLGSLI